MVGREGVFQTHMAKHEGEMKNEASNVVHNNV